MPLIMNIRVEWDNITKNVIYCSFHDRWTWHDCREAMQMVTYLHDSVDYPVSYIYDLTHSKQSARTLMVDIKKLLELPFYPAPEKIVIVEKGYRLQMLTDVLEHIFPLSLPDNLLFAESLNRARALLMKNPLQ
jgi:hypothetical protein